LDRTNIGNAKIVGLQQSLGPPGHPLSAGAYNAALSIFFVSYSLFEPLTNVLLKRLTPKLFIPIIMYSPLFQYSLSAADKRQGHVGSYHDIDGLCLQLVWLDGCSCQFLSPFFFDYRTDTDSGSLVLPKPASSQE
jgi:hypothetical protein